MQRAYQIGDYVHIFNRGTRKTKIARDEKDKWRFMQSLRFFNDSHSSLHVLYQLQRRAGLGGAKSDSAPLALRNAESVFQMRWPKDWPEKDPLVKILCYFLGPNHYHLLLKETREGGISKFMQKLGTGFTNYFNARHKESGSLFQGKYKSKTIKNESYLEYLSVYIQLKNVLELFPGGLQAAVQNLDKSLNFAERYPFSSYMDYIGKRNSLIIDKDILGEYFPKPLAYKEFSKGVIEERKYVILEEEGILEEGV